MLDLAVLGLLEENDLHGYELRKRLGELLGVRLAISFGSLYPALGRLEKAGLVKAVTSLHTAGGPTAPMSGSLVGELAAFRAQRRASTGSGRGTRGKKVYGITDAGRQRLREMLADPDVSDDRDFPVRVAFCHNLEPAERLELFQRRRAELLRRAGQSGGRPAGSDGRMNNYLRSLLERDTAVLAADIAWLDRLTADESDTTTDNTESDTTTDNTESDTTADNTGSHTTATNTESDTTADNTGSHTSADGPAATTSRHPEAEISTP
jgi:DNA-binding PadR family transcriptional regulator